MFMAWLIHNSKDVGFVLTVLIGIYTVYIGIHIQRRRALPSKVKLSRNEIVIAMLLLIVGMFVLGINAVHTFAHGNP